MAWFKVDDGFHSHPKAVASTDAAVGLWTLSGSYSSDYNLLGFVPDSRVNTASRRKSAAILVAVGLWHRAEVDCDCRVTDRRDGGWYFHDWTDCQPSAEDVEAAIEWRRRKDRDRQRRRRERLRNDNQGAEK